jgi:hypothetical protein
MSWWDDEEDVLGDGPADVLKGAWRTLLARREQLGLERPSTAEAMESFAASLRRGPVSPAFRRLVFWRGGQRGPEFSGTHSTPELTAAFTEAISKMANEYQEAHGRLPRPSEMTKTLEFILTPTPDTYLSDGNAEDWTRLQLRAE